MNKLVVVITDEEEVESLALKKARRIASAFDSKVEVVRCVPQSSSDADRQSTAQSINDLVKSVFDDSDRVTSLVVAPDSIPGWVDDNCVLGNDELVVKTGHRSKSLFHTPSDVGLIRQLHSPLLISCNRKWKSKPNVLIALDLSSDDAPHRELNDLALRWGRRWEAVHDCQLHALYCVPIPAPLLELDIVERHEYQRKHEPDAREKLVALLEKSGMSDVIPHIEAGTPEKSIGHTAKQLKADLVIMGSVGHVGVQRLFHHNTAEKALHYLRTDMLVVKPSLRLP